MLHLLFSRTCWILCSPIRSGNILMTPMVWLCWLVSTKILKQLLTYALMPISILVSKWTKWLLASSALYLALLLSSIKFRLWCSLLHYPRNEKCLLLLSSKLITWVTLIFLMCAQLYLHKIKEKLLVAKVATISNKPTSSLQSSRSIVTPTFLHQQIAHKLFNFLTYLRGCK